MIVGNELAHLSRCHLQHERCDLRTVMLRLQTRRGAEANNNFMNYMTPGYNKFEFSHEAQV